MMIHSYSITSIQFFHGGVQSAIVVKITATATPTLYNTAEDIAVYFSLSIRFATKAESEQHANAAATGHIPSFPATCAPAP
jgi:hypothetical protein